MKKKTLLVSALSVFLLALSACDVTVPSSSSSSSEIPASSSDVGPSSTSSLDPSSSSSSSSSSGSPVVPVSSVTLNEHNLELDVGDTFQLVPTVLPADATDKTVHYDVDHNTIVDVNINTGLITALKPGVATVTASCNDKNDTCVVIVNEEVDTSFVITMDEAPLTNHKVVGVAIKANLDQSDFDVVPVAVNGLKFTVDLGENPANKYSALNFVELKEGVTTFDPQRVEEDAYRISNTIKSADFKTGNSSWLFGAMISILSEEPIEMIKSGDSYVANNVHVTKDDLIEGCYNYGFKLEIFDYDNLDSASTGKEYFGSEEVDNYNPLKALKSGTFNFTITGSSLKVDLVEIDPEYTITFSAGDGSGSMEPVVMQAGTFVLPESTFTAPEGKQFEGWQVGNEAELQYPDDEIDIEGNVTITAIYEEIPVFVPCIWISSDNWATQDSIDLEPGTSTGVYGKSIELKAGDSLFVQYAEDSYYHWSDLSILGTYCETCLAKSEDEADNIDVKKDCEYTIYVNPESTQGKFIISSIYDQPGYVSFEVQGKSLGIELSYDKVLGAFTGLVSAEEGKQVGVVIGKTPYTSEANKMYLHNKAGELNNLKYEDEKYTIINDVDGAKVEVYLGENGAISVFLKSQTEDAYYIVGKIGGVDKWTSTEYKLIYNQQTNEYSLEDYISLKEGDGIKVMNTKGYQYYPVGSGEEYQVTVDGKYQFYFDPAGGHQDWYYGYFYVERNNEKSVVITGAVPTHNVYAYGWDSSDNKYVAIVDSFDQLTSTYTFDFGANTDSITGYMFVEVRDDLHPITPSTSGNDWSTIVLRETNSLTMSDTSTEWKAIVNQVTVAPLADWENPVVYPLTYNQQQNSYISEQITLNVDDKFFLACENYYLHYANLLEAFCTPETYASFTHDGDGNLVVVTAGKYTIYALPDGFSIVSEEDLYRVKAKVNGSPIELTDIKEQSSEYKAEYRIYLADGDKISFYDRNDNELDLYYSENPAVTEFKAVGYKFYDFKVDADFKVTITDYATTSKTVSIDEAIAEGNSVAVWAWNKDKTFGKAYPATIDGTSVTFNVGADLFNVDGFLLVEVKEGEKFDGSDWTSAVVVRKTYDYAYSATNSCIWEKANNIYVNDVANALSEDTDNVGYFKSETITLYRNDVLYVKIVDGSGDHYLHYNNLDLVKTSETVQGYFSGTGTYNDFIVLQDGQYIFHANAEGVFIELVKVIHDYELYKLAYGSAVDSDPNKWTWDTASVGTHVDIEEDKAIGQVKYQLTVTEPLNMKVLSIKGVYYGDNYLEGNTPDESDSNIYLDAGVYNIYFKIYTNGYKIALDRTKGLAIYVNGAWNQSKLATEKVDGKYVFEVNGLKAGDVLSFSYDAYGKDTDMENNNLTDGMAIIEGGDLTVTVDPVALKVRVSGYTPVPVVNNYALVGSMNGWVVTDTTYSFVSTGENQVSLLNVQLAKDAKFKVCINGVWNGCLSYEALSDDAKSLDIGGTKVFVDDKDDNHNIILAFGRYYNCVINTQNNKISASIVQVSITQKPSAEGEATNIPVDKGVEYFLPANPYDAPSGQQFAGWLVNEQVKQPGASIGVLTDDITIIATWEDIPVEKYTVTYKANGGTGDDVVVDNVAGSYKLKDTNPFTAPKNKVFKCWMIGEVEYALGAGITVNENTIVNATWEDIPVVHYYVVGKIDGDSGKWSTKEYELSENPSVAGEFLLSEPMVLKNGDGIKVMNAGATVYYPDGSGNEYQVAKDGVYQIYFRPDGQGGEGWYSGYFYVQELPVATTLEVSYSGGDIVVNSSINNLSTLTITVKDQFGNKVEEFLGSAGKEGVTYLVDGVAGNTVTVIKNNTVITVQYLDLSNTFNVNVIEQVIPVTALAIRNGEAEYTSGTLFMGETLTLNCAFTPANTTQAELLAWKSSDDTVATVANGVVTPVKEGTVTITAFIDLDQDGVLDEEETVKDTCQVTVEYKYTITIGSKKVQLTKSNNVDQGYDEKFEYVGDELDIAKDETIAVRIAGEDKDVNPKAGDLLNTNNAVKVKVSDESFALLTALAANDVQAYILHKNDGDVWEVWLTGVTFIDACRTLVFVDQEMDAQYAFEDAYDELPEEEKDNYLAQYKTTFSIAANQEFKMMNMYSKDSVQYDCYQQEKDHEYFVNTVNTVVKSKYAGQITAYFKVANDGNNTVSVYLGFVGANYKLQVGEAPQTDLVFDYNSGTVQFKKDDVALSKDQTFKIFDTDGKTALGLTPEAGAEEYISYDGELKTYTVLKDCTVDIFAKAAGSVYFGVHSTAETIYKVLGIGGDWEYQNSTAVLVKDKGQLPEGVLHQWSLQIELAEDATIKINDGSKEAWIGYSAIEEGGAKANFAADGSDNIVVNVEGIYKIYLKQYSESFGLYIEEVAPYFDFTGKVITRFDNDGGKIDLGANSWAANYGHEAHAEVTKPCSDIWRAGMFINTGITMTAGKTYRVRFDVAHATEGAYNVILQCKQWTDDGKTDEQRYAFSNLKEAKYDKQFTVTEANKGSLWILVEMGSAVNEVTISNLNVVEVEKQSVTFKATCDDVLEGEALYVVGDFTFVDETAWKASEAYKMIYDNTEKCYKLTIQLLPRAAAYQYKFVRAESTNPATYAWETIENNRTFTVSDAAVVENEGAITFPSRPEPQTEYVVNIWSKINIGNANVDKPAYAWIFTNNTDGKWYAATHVTESWETETNRHYTVNLGSVDPTGKKIVFVVFSSVTDDTPNWNDKIVQSADGTIAYSDGSFWVDANPAS